MPSTSRVRALALSCHPLPTVAVTALSAGLAALAHLPAGRGVLLTATIFTGQLSIGWSNDYLDAERDRAAQRSDKPVATGAVTPRMTAMATVAAIILTLTLSALLGRGGGSTSMLIVLCGLLYNVALKSTVLSWLPYAIAFGCLPAVATLSAEPSRWPAVWALAAGALLGVAAHLANVLPDLRDDIATGVRGLPHRLGTRGTALGTAVLLLAASAVILFGPDGPPGPWGWTGFLAATLLAGVAVTTAYRNPSSRRFFQATILIGALDLLSFALSGVRL